MQKNDVRASFFIVHKTHENQWKAAIHRKRQLLDIKNYKKLLTYYQKDYKIESQTTYNQIDNN